MDMSGRATNTLRPSAPHRSCSILVHQPGGELGQPQLDAATVSSTSVCIEGRGLQGLGLATASYLGL